MSVEPNKPIGKIVTLSQLPELQALHKMYDTEYVPEKSYIKENNPLKSNFEKSFIELSYQENEQSNKYSSYKLSLSSLIRDGIEQYLANQYNLINENKEKLNLYKNELSVSDILESGTKTEPFELSGYKQFKFRPRIDETFDLTTLNSDNGFATLGEVKDITNTTIHDQKVYLDYDNSPWISTPDEGQYWNLINGNRNYNTFTISKSEFIRIECLMASEQNVSPDKCYVNLKVKNPNDDTWRIMDRKPWIVGAYASVYQPVIFSEYISEGVVIKVEPEFDIISKATGNTSTYNVIRFYTHTAGIVSMNS